VEALLEADPNEFLIRDIPLGLGLGFGLGIGLGLGLDMLYNI
jgi:hypothetical protein